MKHTAINIVLFVGIVGAMFGIQAVDNHGEEHEVARQELAKQRREERFAKAAQQICGNGYAVDVEGAIVCRVRKALKDGKASL